MASESRLWYLDNFNLYNEVCRDAPEHMENKIILKNTGKNQFIYFPEEPSTTIYFIKSGRVKIGTYSPDGKEIIKAILGFGEMFGELGLIGEEKRTDFAQAMDDNVQICALSMKDFEGLMRMSSDFSLKVTKIIGFRLRKIERRLESLIFKDARTRIVDFIADTAEEKGKILANGEILIRLSLTHQDISKLTATSRQTVTTVLNELKEHNKIFFDRKKIIVRKLEQLA